MSVARVPIEMGLIFFTFLDGLMDFVTGSLQYVGMQRSIKAFNDLCVDLAQLATPAEWNSDPVLINVNEPPRHEKSGELVTELEIDIVPSHVFCHYM